MGFKVGENVIFKSNGRLMKVIGNLSDGSVWCEWRYEDKIQEGIFSPDQLVSLLDLKEAGGIVFIGRTGRFGLVDNPDKSLSVWNDDDLDGINGLLRQLLTITVTLLVISALLIDRVPSVSGCRVMWVVYLILALGGELYGITPVKSWLHTTNEVRDMMGKRKVKSLMWSGVMLAAAFVSLFVGMLF